MEGKTPFSTVILGAVILSLVLAQIQVEAKSCCPSTTARNCYNVCRLGGKIPRPVCASTCGCKNVDGKCLPGYEKGILENSGSITEYCKLGCASSLCNAIGTLQHPGLDAGEEVVNEAVEQCTKACSVFCTKGSIIALENV